jgi:hypothetical protein
MLSVSIYLDCKIVTFPNCNLQTRLNCSANAQIARQRYDAGKPLENMSRVVGRTIVNDDDIAIGTFFVQCLK